MTYHYEIPIVIGLFTLTTAILIGYFIWLWSVLRTNPKRDFVIVATLSMIIMVVGLLLTGFRQ